MNSNINLNLYKTFYEVAKYNSISAAAKEMYMSQPAVSRSLKNLENLLGVKLFNRNLNGCVLTLKGRELYEGVEEAFKILRLAEKRIEENKNKIIGTISIGVRSHIATFYLMDKVLNFKKKYKNVDIAIISRPSKELLRLFKNNEIDFIIDSFSERDNLDGLDVKYIDSFNYMFVAHKDYDCSKIKSLKDLSKEYVILPVKSSVHRKNLDVIAKENNVKFKDYLNIETSELLLDLVRKNVGIGYLINVMVSKDIEKGLLKEIKIKEKLPSIDLKIVYDKNTLLEIPGLFIKEFEEL